MKSVRCSSDPAVVSLDAAGTLVEPWPSVGEVYVASLRLHGGPSLPAAQVNRAFMTAWKRRERFDYSKDSWRLLFRDSIGAQVGDRVLGAAFEEAFARFGRAEHWRVYEDVVPALEGLRARGMRLVVLSNFDDRLCGLLDALGLSRFCERVVVSGTVGLHKPEAGLFLHMTQLMGVAPSEVLHVGDSFREDVEGATQAGCRAMFLDRHGTHPGTPNRIETLMGLLDAG